MPNVRTLQRSFAGGEISPEMYGQIGDAKYQSGLALCRNFICKPQGPIENRAGLGFVRAVKDSTAKVRVIPFTYSTTQTMLLEMGAGYFRFHTLGATVMDGAVPYEIENPYAEEDLFDIHYVQSADVLTLVHPDYAPRELRRLAATNWTLTPISFTPSITAPATVTAVASGHTEEKYWYYYVVTSIAADGVSESSPSIEAYDRGNVYETGGIVTLYWTPVAGASRYYVYKKQGGIYGYIGSTETLSLIDDNIQADLSHTPPTYDSMFRADGIISVPVEGGGSGYGTVYTGGVITEIVMTNVGSGYSDSPTVNIVDATGSGAVLTPTVVAGEITGIVVTNGGTLYSDPTITITDETGTGAALNATITPRLIPPVTLSVTDATGSGAILSPVISGGVIMSVVVERPGEGYTHPTVSVSVASGGSHAAFGQPVLGERIYPAAVSYFEQRRCFAGTIEYPQTIWMTKSGTESNMSYSLPVRDDDRISVRVAAREANTIRHIVPLSQLLLLTSAAEWRVTSINSDAITPTSISVRPQSYVGASNVQPVIVNTNLIYGAARGGHIQECSYNWQANGFMTGDLSLRTAHLFDNFDIVDMAYSKAPQPIIWFVSSSGKLLGLTYIPEQQIGAWHQHDTLTGVFESVAVVAEGREDVLYVVVKRLINGIYTRNIERLHTRAFTNLEDAFFVDAGLTFDGNNTGDTTIMVSGGTLWDSTEDLTLTASAATFVFPATTDVGDAIVLTDAAGVKYTLTILSTSSTTVATARVDRVLAAALRGTATAVWGFARNSLSGLNHLEGETVSILADGAVHPGRVVVSGGITLDAPAVVVQAGLPIQADAQMLPLAMQVDAGFGQGRYKNVNKAWLRVYRSSGIWVGPDADNLVEAKQRTTELYGVPPALKSEEISIMLSPSWADSGAVYIRQEDPLPLTVAALTLEVSIGG
jgi:hypothetical protein